MNGALPLLATAFVTGLLGSAHCLGMCGGLSALFAVSPEAEPPRAQWPRALAYNAGRLITYAVFGLLVAALGKGAVDLMPSLAAPVRLASGLLIVVIGLQIAFDWRLLAPLEATGARLWQVLAPLARRLMPVRSGLHALVLGFIWGWLPCGLVYSVLLLAATAAMPVDGALIMLAFGLGTLPAMLATGLSGAKLSQRLSRRRLAAGLLIVLLGMATVAMPAMKLTATESHAGHASRSAP